MPLFLVTYDLDCGQTPFMAAAPHHGWTYLTVVGREVVRLPETTLHGRFASLATASAAFDAVKRDAEKALGGKIKVEKRYLTGKSGANVISDKRAALVPAHTASNDPMQTCLRHQIAGVL